MALPILTVGESWKDFGQAGFQTAYLGQFNDTAMTWTYAGDGITINSFGGTWSGFNTFKFRPEQATSNISAVISTDNNSMDYTQTIILPTYVMTANLISKVQQIGQGFWRLILIDKNGLYQGFGFNYGLSVTAIEGGIGRVGSDTQGFMISLTGHEQQASVIIAASASAQVIVA